MYSAEVQYSSAMVHLESGDWCSRIKKCCNIQAHGGIVQSSAGEMHVRCAPVAIWHLQHKVQQVQRKLQARPAGNRNGEQNFSGKTRRSLIKRNPEPDSLKSGTLTSSLWFGKVLYCGCKTIIQTIRNKVSNCEMRMQSRAGQIYLEK